MKEQKRFYITKKGHVREIGDTEEPFDTEMYGLINWFSTRLRAREIRDIIEDNRPRAFLCLTKRV